MSSAANEIKDERLKGGITDGLADEAARVGRHRGRGPGPGLLSLHRRQRDVHARGLHELHVSRSPARHPRRRCRTSDDRWGVRPLRRLDDRVRRAVLRRVRGDVRHSAGNRHSRDAGLRCLCRCHQRSNRATDRIAVIHRHPGLPVHLPGPVPGGAQGGDGRLDAAARGSRRCGRGISWLPSSAATPFQGCSAGWRMQA